MRYPIRLAAVLLSSSLLTGGARGGPAAADRPHVKSVEIAGEAAVSWDFGSGPGKMSSAYVGERRMLVTYDSSSCSTRFTLLKARFEYASVKRDGKLRAEGPPTLTLTFRKQFVGEFDLFPRVTITQNDSGRSIRAIFPNRERSMAAPVRDMLSEGIEVSVGAPGEIMELHNPVDWSGIEVSCGDVPAD